MKYNRFFRLRFFVSAFFLTAFFFIPVYAQSGINILNPVAGVWANYQSLVLDLPEGTEAFYSLNGEDPSVSGLAYDGPVVLNIAGNVQLSLVTIEPDGTRTPFEVRYTVVLKQTPNYIEDALAFSAPVNANGAVNTNGIHPLIRIDSSAYVDIPQELSYMLGDTGVLFSGRRLALSIPTVFERYVSLVVYDGEIPFRYVLHTGGDGGKVEDEDGKNFLTDNSPFSFPAHCTLRGVPQFPAVNKAVELSFDDADFSFCIQTKDARRLYSPVFTVDALEGDAFGFSQDIDVLYKGVKYASVRPSFIIDKIAPQKPVFISSEKDFYARKSVALSIQSGAPVYYYLGEPLKSETGFSLSDIKTLSDSLAPAAEKEFVPLTTEDLILQNAEKQALLYTIYAYSRDAAGNKSETVRFQTVVDTANYYVVSASEKRENSDSPVNGFVSVFSEKADGSPDKPFTDCSLLYEALQKSQASFARCFISGSFTGLGSLVLNRDMEIYGDGRTRLCFEKGAFFEVNGASFVLKNCTLEQNNGGLDDVFQTRLIKADNARLFFSNAELICRGADNVSCIAMENSSVAMENSGISAEAAVYADGISAKSSVLNVNKARSQIIAPTAVGVKTLHSSALIENSSFSLLGKLMRALEFADSGFTLNNNRFIAEKNESVFTENSPIRNAVSDSAVWTNMPLPEDISVIEKDTASFTSDTNAYSGFSRLYGGL